MTMMYINWSRLLKNVGKGIDMIKEDDLQFDTLLGIMRGGGFIANTIHKSNICWNYVKVWSSKYDVKGEVINEEPQLYSGVPGGIKDKVLIVDDILDTGDTMKTVINRCHIKSGEIFVAFARSKWKDYPTFEGLRLNVGEFVGDEWLVFPWDRMEKTKEMV